MTKTPKSGYQDVSSNIPRRLIWVSSGREKTGKNHFGLTAPGPIYGQYFDPGGLEGVAEKFLTAPLGPKEIKACYYRFSKRKDAQDYATEVKEKFIADYHEALNHARTIQWDETEFWEVCRFAEFGRESAKGRDYGPLNGEIRSLIMDSYDAGVNLQMIQKVKELWENDKPTGEMIGSGFKQAANVAQVNLRHHWTLETGFQTTVINCRQNMGIAGDVNTDLDFVTLAQLVFPDTDESDWA